MDTIKLRGDYLLQALERSVEEYDPEDPGGQFLQFSGTYVYLYTETSNAVNGVLDTL